MEYNSDFKYDLKLGQLGEQKLGELLDNSKIEVKTDFKLKETGNIAVEYESRGQLSGIATSEAEWFAFVEGQDEDVMILIKKDKLKELCRKPICKKVKGGDNNTSKMVLVPYRIIL